MKKLILLVMLLLTGCNCSSVTNIKEAKPSRFERKQIGGGLYLIKDFDKDKEYLLFYDSNNSCMVPLAN